MEITSYLLGKKSSGGGGGGEYETFQSYITNCENMFKASTETKIIIPEFNPPNVTSLKSMFYACENLEEIDISGLEGNNVSVITQAFNWCSKLKKIDARNFNFAHTSSYNSAFSNMPQDCLIIVKNATQKQWLNTKYNSLTNVKTVEEYEQ